jgi:hypothetical protein
MNPAFRQEFLRPKALSPVKETPLKFSNFLKVELAEKRQNKDNITSY